MGKHQFARGVKCGACGQVVAMVEAMNQHEAAVGRGRCAECLAKEVAGLTQALSGEMVGGGPAAEAESVVAENAPAEPAEVPEPAPKRRRSRKVVEAAAEAVEPAEPVAEAEERPAYERREPHGLFLTRH